MEAVLTVLNSCLPRWRPHQQSIAIILADKSIELQNGLLDRAMSHVIQDIDFARLSLFPIRTLSGATQNSHDSPAHRGFFQRVHAAAYGTTNELTGFDYRIVCDSRLCTD